MFEDSLMESGGKIKTKSKYWMIGTFIFNGAILATMILIPLLYPEALPKTAMTAMLTAPPPPPPPPPPRFFLQHDVDPTRPARLAIDSGVRFSGS